MENKKININNLSAASSIINSINIPKKNNSKEINLPPQLAKLFIRGMLKSKGMDQDKINDTINILDSNLKQTKTTPFNEKKETNDKIQLDSSNKKETNDIPVKNDLDDSLDSTKLV